MSVHTENIWRKREEAGADITGVIVFDTSRHSSSDNAIEEPDYSRYPKPAPKGRYFNARRRRGRHPRHVRRARR